MAAVLVPLAFLVFLELVLRLVGFGHSTGFLIASSNGGTNTFIQNNKFGWRFFGERKSRTPAPFSITREKLPGTIRIIVFGESAAYGDPQAAFGLPRVLQATLALRHPDLKFEVVNAAMTAINSHVILPIARDCVKARADIWVVYMGNNEVVGPFGAGTVFGAQALALPLVRADLALKSTRLGELGDALRDHMSQSPANQREWGGMLMFLGQQVPKDDARLNRVYSSFEKNLLDIIRAGHDAGAGVVVSTVAVNLKDCAPFASQEPPAASANAQFRLGRDLLARGERAGAQAALRRARDLDTLRFRCDSRLNDLIRHCAAGHEADRILLADAEHQFDLAAPDGVPGWEYFYEHVHLTFAGNCLLAQILAGQIETLLPATTSPPRPWPSVTECAQRLGWTPRDRQAALGEILSRIVDPPFVNQANHDSQVQFITAQWRQLDAPDSLQTALRATQSALRDSPDDALLNAKLAALELDAGNAPAAEADARRAIALVPSSDEYWAQLGTACAHQEKFADAADAFEHAFNLNPADVSQLQNAATALAKLGRDKEAMRDYRRALTITPQFGLAWIGLGQLLEKSGDKDGAQDCFQKGLRNRLHRASDLTTLARFCMGRGWLEAAATNFDDAVKLDPFNYALMTEAGQAHFLWGVQLGKAGQSEAAVGQFREAARLMPDVVEARLNLGIALYHARQLNESLTQFQEVIKRSPDNAVALRYLNLLQPKR
jgi:tetratricopeptide (TPR) repeat protein